MGRKKPSQDKGDPLLNCWGYKFPRFWVVSSFCVLQILKQSSEYYRETKIRGGVRPQPRKTLAPGVLHQVE